MNLIFAETHYWDSAPCVDSHHLTREMTERGHDVLYLSSPISPFHFLDLRAWRHKWRRAWRYGGRGRMAASRLRCAVPFTLAPVQARRFLDSPRLLDLTLRLTAPQLRRTIRSLGFECPDAIVIQSLYFSRLPRLLPNAPLIYRMTDDISSFPGVASSLVRSEPGLVRAADLTTASSQLLVRRAESMGAGRVECLPHGVAMDLYDQTAVDYAARDKRVAYVGAIDSWFDSESVAAAAKAMPDWLFELAGPVGAANLDPIRDLSNVRMAGPIPHRSVPAFLHSARIGIIPFLRNDLIDAVHPLKLYEYLAAGLPVVSTRWDELERIDAPVAMTSSPQEFASATMRAAQDGPSAKGLDFARANDWSERAQRLEELIESLL